jgi:hypothetical protein
MSDSESKRWKFPDSRMPTEQERQALSRMLFHALLEIRVLGYEGKSEQAADLADAFHNLPIYLWSEDFSFGFFRKFLEGYHQKYSEVDFNYLGMLDEITERGPDFGGAV